MTGSTPPASSPSQTARAERARPRAASSPKARSPITGSAPGAGRSSTGRQSTVMPSAARSSAMSRAPSRGRFRASAPPSARDLRRRRIGRANAAAEPRDPAALLVDQHRRVVASDAVAQLGDEARAPDPASSQLRANRMKPSGSASRKKARSVGVERRARAARRSRRSGSRLGQGCTRPCAASARRTDAAAPRRVGDRAGLDAVVDAALAEIDAHRDRRSSVPSRSALVALQPRPFLLRRVVVRARQLKAIAARCRRRGLRAAAARRAPASGWRRRRAAAVGAGAIRRPASLAAARSGVSGGRGRRLARRRRGVAARRRRRGRYGRRRGRPPCCGGCGNGCFGRRQKLLDLRVPAALVVRTAMFWSGTLMPPGLVGLAP